MDVVAPGDAMVNISPPRMLRRERASLAEKCLASDDQEIQR